MLPYFAKLNPRFNVKIGTRNATVRLIIKKIPISSLDKKWANNERVDIPIIETNNWEKKVRGNPLRKE